MFWGPLSNLPTSKLQLYVVESGGVYLLNNDTVPTANMGALSLVNAETLK